jgi:hypothetical protein
MFSTTTPEKPAWILAALSIIGGVILLALHHTVPGVLQGLALAGLVAAVALADAGTSNMFAWGLVILALVGIVVLALLSDALPTWLEAVAGLGVAGGASLSIPTSGALAAAYGPSGAVSRPVQGSPATSGPIAPHVIGPKT